MEVISNLFSIISKSKSHDIDSSKAFGKPLVSSL